MKKKSLPRKILESFFPPECLDCSRPISDSPFTHLCSECASKVTPIQQSPLPRCKKCDARLFSKDLELCYDCFHNPPPFEKKTSVFYYHHPLIRKLVHLFKFEYQKSAGKDLAQLFKPFLPSLLFSTKIISIPVPLSPSSLKKRGFNQVSLLLKFLDIPFQSHLLARKDHRVAQSSLSRKQRMLSVASQFYVIEDSKKQIRNQSFLLIDDIYTTGSTTRSLTQLLKNNGAKEVFVFTFLRD